MYKKLYYKVLLTQIATLLVIIGGINWLTSAYGYNLVDMLCRFISSLVQKDLPIDKIIYILVGVSAIWLAMRRDTWLPFLGRTVIPSNLIPLKENSKHDTIIKVQVKPNVKIAYWAGAKKTENTDVITAYGDYSNSGVVMSDANGIAELKVLKGTGYIVPSGRHIPGHVHYRELNNEWAMIGPIKTVFY